MGDRNQEVYSRSLPRRMICYRYEVYQPRRTVFLAFVPASFRSCHRSPNPITSSSPPPPAQGRERIGKLVPYLFNFRSRGNNIHRARSDTKRHTHLSDGYCSLPLESIGKLAFLYPPVKPPYSSPLFIPIAANESTPIFLFSPPKPPFLYHPLTPCTRICI